MRSSSKNLSLRLPLASRAGIVAVSRVAVMAVVVVAPTLVGGPRGAAGRPPPHQLATCAEIKQRCLAHATAMESKRANGTLASPDASGADGMSSAGCLDQFNQAMNSGFWPGHNGMPPSRCQQ